MRFVVQRLFQFVQIPVNVQGHVHRIRSAFVVRLTACLAHRVSKPLRIGEGKVQGDVVDDRFATANFFFFVDQFESRSRLDQGHAGQSVLLASRFKMIIRTISMEIDGTELQ
jgi:hypothetical protein